MTEEWRPVLGFPYEASSEGRVRHLSTTARPVCHPLRAFWDRRGYGRIVLCYGDGTKRKRISSLHQAVALAFIGACPDGKEVGHKDHNKRNNRPENLEYVTPVENAQASQWYWTRLRGVAHHLGRRLTCKWGHVFTPENTRRLLDGSRECRTCRRESDQRRQQRQKGAA